MRIIIIGSGTVGTATGDGFQRFGNDVIFYDTDSERLEKLESLGFHVINDLSGKNADVFFICTPEDIIENVICSLPYKDNLVVIRSSVLPGTTNALIKKTGGGHIAINPEFLREATAIDDFLNPFRIVYSACCQKHRELLEKLYKPFQSPMVYVDDPAVAEMVKYGANLFLATVISYWNEIDNLCLKLDINSHVVGKIAAMDPRIPSYGASQHGKPLGGRCFPQNIRQFIAFCKKLNYNPVLIKALEEVNRSKS
jgi:UDPglucose 6-dehydrogenase